MRANTMIVLALIAAAAIRPAAAQIGSDRYAALIETADGRILTSANPDEMRHPASLAKLMTLYLTFEALRDRRIAFGQLVPVSAEAASQAPSKLGLTPGTPITVHQAILSLVTKSANDSAAALGEMLGGSEDRFAAMMTLRARALGMSRTTFRNASGLPDPDQWTTARDLALLARRLIADFPTYYPFFSTPIFVYRGQVIPNHDHLLEMYPGADGMKTGYTEASGLNLVSSALRENVRLVGVVLGAASGPERDNHMMALLDSGFAELGVGAGRPSFVARAAPVIGIARAQALPTPPLVEVARAPLSRAARFQKPAPAIRSAGVFAPRATGAASRVARAVAPRWVASAAAPAREKAAPHKGRAGIASPSTRRFVSR